MRNNQSSYTKLIKETPPYFLEKDCMIKENMAEN